MSEGSKVGPVDGKVPENALGRFDFHIEVLSSDRETGRFSVQLIPNPKRYEKSVLEGESVYLDRYLRIVIPERMFLESFSEQLPIYHLEPRIESTSEYSVERRDAISRELQGQPYSAPSSAPASHRTLAPEQPEINLAFLSLDICGSTRIRSQDAEAYDRAFKIFIAELTTVVGQFNGSTLKVTGDGFIAFIEHPSFVRQCDNIVDLGLSLISFLHAAINPALVAAGLPSFSVRVGADFGPARVQNIDVLATGYRTTEVFSDALNRAVKIEQSASPNELRVGRRLYELIHTQWLERGEQVLWNPAPQGMETYQIYRITPAS